MTDEQLDAVEAALGHALPAEYRRVSRAFPFRPLARDAVYWFSDDPGRVIDETLEPLGDGGYDRAGWRTGYVAIGRGAAGDPYLLDTTAPGLPVHLLSHETHEIEPAWPTFAAFVAEWLAAPAEVAGRAAEKAAAEAAVTRARMRRGYLVAGLILAACVLLPLLMGLVLVR